MYAALVAAMTDILPDIMTAAQQPPTPEATAKAGKPFLVIPDTFFTPLDGIQQHNSLSVC